MLPLSAGRIRHAREHNKTGFNPLILHLKKDNNSHPNGHRRGALYHLARWPAGFTCDGHLH